MTTKTDKVYTEIAEVFGKLFAEDPTATHATAAVAVKIQNAIERVDHDFNVNKFWEHVGYYYGKRFDELEAKQA